ncbi:transposase [Amycolatopsis thermalba]|uniref:transposase n=1 Tax=Amycolatopsis thermalba TaxID=944492 RepID=UPI0032119B98
MGRITRICRPSRLFPHLMRHLRVARPGRGDQASSSRAVRGHLRARGIVAVIPGPADQVGHRTRRGSRGGRPPAFDSTAYRGRNVVERRFNLLKQWRGLATRYDELAIVSRSAVVLHTLITWTKGGGLAGAEVVPDRGGRRWPLSVLGRA